MDALSAAQATIKPPERNRTVTVRSKMGGQYSFKYATLSAVIEAIRKPFTDNGLWFTQVVTYSVDLGAYKLKTMLLHNSGQFISSEVPIIAEGGSNQQFGSALTYMKRYTLSSMVGLAADEDDDGNLADGNEVQAMQESVRKAGQPAPSPLKEDPISTGPMIAPGTYKIEVPMLPDESGSDWMKWGQLYMGYARNTNKLEELLAFEKANEEPLKNMQKTAPKMYTNMMIALVKVKQGLEKPK